MTMTNNRLTVLATSICLLLAFIGLNFPFARSIASDKKENLVYVIKSLDVVYKDSGDVIITTTGSVPSGGWSDPKLIQRSNNTTSANIEFYFFATRPPANIAVTRGFEDVEASYIIQKSQLAGKTKTQVLALSNSMESSLRN